MNVFNQLQLNKPQIEWELRIEARNQKADEAAINWMNVSEIGTEWKLIKTWMQWITHNSNIIKQIKLIPQSIKPEFIHRATKATFWIQLKFNWISGIKFVWFAVIELKKLIVWIEFAESTITANHSLLVQNWLNPH